MAPRDATPDVFGDWHHFGSHSVFRSHLGLASNVALVTDARLGLARDRSGTRRRARRQWEPTLDPLGSADVPTLRVCKVRHGPLAGRLYGAPR